MVPFKKLALGTRFKYPGNNYTWVKISTYLIAMWDESQKTTGWVGQSICSFDEDDDLDKNVIVL